MNTSIVEATEKPDGCLIVVLSRSGKGKGMREQYITLRIDSIGPRKGEYTLFVGDIAQGPEVKIQGAIDLSIKGG